MKYSIMFFVVLVSVTVHTTIGSATNCTEVCTSLNNHDESLAVHCGCHMPHGGNHHHEKTTEVPMIVRISTLSLCDYLCSIQQGGAACDCSVSIVPGK